MAAGVGDDGVSALYLACDAFATKANQIVGVRIGMARNFMTCLGQPGHNAPPFGVFFQVLGNHEKRGLDPVLGKEIHQARQGKVQNCTSHVLGGRAREGVNTVVTLDRIEVD
jgi:hypothetical protein